MLKLARTAAAAAAAPANVVTLTAADDEVVVVMFICSLQAPVAPVAEVPNLLKKELAGVCKACFSPDAGSTRGRIVQVKGGSREAGGWMEGENKEEGPLLAGHGSLSVDGKGLPSYVEVLI